jgi:hypothetical protein
MAFEIPVFMEFLMEEYNVYKVNLLEEGKEDPFELVDDYGDDAPVASFIAWATDYLANVNQPINTAYLASGLGIRLQRGQTVSFRPQKPEDTGMRDEGVHITRPQTIPGFSGIVPSESYNVFGS